MDSQADVKNELLAEIARRIPDCNVSQLHTLSECYALITGKLQSLTH